MTEIDKIIKELLKGNEIYIKEKDKEINNVILGQKPKIAVLTCSDSRVIPEFIFNKSLGELFVVRVAGNVAIDETIISSLEYAVDHLKVKLLIILGHTRCGAVQAAEDKNNLCRLFDEIRHSFPKNEKDHIRANLEKQLENICKKSKIISNAIKENNLQLKGVVYCLETGKVAFL